jgi:hypothetical protein
MTKKSDFALKFYTWAQESFQRELAQDFPLLSRVDDSAAVRIIQFMRTLSPHLRSVLASGLVKRFHSDAVRTLDIAPTDQEASLVKAVLDAPIPLPSLAKWAKAAMRQSCDEEVSPVFGRKNLPWHRNICEVSETIGELHVSTMIDVGSTINKLSYEHTIVFPEGSEFPRVSILSWLGIAFETDWNLATDPVTAAKALRGVCEHFLIFMRTMATS